MRACRSHARTACLASVARPVLVFFAVVVLAACRGRTTFLEEVRSDWRGGRFEEAADRLERERREHEADRHVYGLNLGMAELALGRPEQAVESFRSARDRMDDLAVEDSAGWFKAAIESDASAPYPGEDYEQIAVRALLSVASLASEGDEGDAVAFAEQVFLRQREIIEAFSSSGEGAGGENPKRAYKTFGFGAYLEAILYEDDPLRYDRAARAYERLADYEPMYPFADEDIERTRYGRFAPPDHGVVHVIALVGTGPYKVETTEPVSAEAIALVQWYLAIMRNRFVFPNIQEVRIPALVTYADNPTEMIVEVDGERLGRTSVVTDLVEVARRQFAALRDHVVARAVLRRIFKVGVTEGVKAAIGSETDEQRVAGLGLDILGNVWTSRERADLRNWALLPATFQAARIELPAGAHRLTFRAAVEGTTTGAPQTVDVDVRSGYSTFVVVMAPSPRGGPPPLTSAPSSVSASASASASVRAGVATPETRPEG